MESMVCKRSALLALARRFTKVCSGRVVRRCGREVLNDNVQRVSNDNVQGGTIGNCQGIANECGQGTVEFALVTVALMAVIVGLAAMWRLTSDGVLMQHVVAAASHHVEGSIGSVADIFVY